MAGDASTSATRAACSRASAAACSALVTASCEAFPGDSMRLAGARGALPGLGSGRLSPLHGFVVAPGAAFDARDHFVGALLGLDLEALADLQRLVNAGEGGLERLTSLLAQALADLLGGTGDALGGARRFPGGAAGGGGGLAAGGCGLLRLLIRLVDEAEGAGGEPFGGCGQLLGGFADGG